MKKVWEAKFQPESRISVLFMFGFLLLALFGGQSVRAAPGGHDFQQAFDFMKGLGCAQGYTDGSAHLDDNLTRAQAVTILVNCTGQAANAKILQGAPAFPDTGSHPWASGAIAVAKNMGWVGGLPDGKFHPDDKVTYGQLVQMLDNALGLQTNAALGWPERAIKAAIDAGFLSADANLLAYADGFAPRGAAFFYANSAFMNVNLSSGKTVYQTYLKGTAPTLDVSLSNNSPTSEASVVLTGTAKGAFKVTVNGTGVTLNADGTFSTSINLKIGDNVIKVVASDVVNNSTTKSITITRSLKLSKLTVNPGGDLQNNLSVPVTFTATGEYSDGSKKESEQVKWSISPNTASITDEGIAKFPNYGTYTVKAEKDGVVGTSEVRIVSPPSSTVYVPAPQGLKMQAVGAISTSEGVQIRFTPLVTGNRPGTLMFSASRLPAGIKIDGATGEISGVVEYSNATLEKPEEVIPVTVSVTDSSGTSSSQIFNWTVTNVDTKPVVGDLKILSNADFVGNHDYTIPVTDPDGDPLTFLMDPTTPLPSALELDSHTGKITRSIDDAVKLYPVLITVTDGRNPITLILVFDNTDTTAP